MQNQWKALLFGSVLALSFATPVYAIDRDNNPPGPAGGPGASPNRR